VRRADRFVNGLFFRPKLRHCTQAEMGFAGWRQWLIREKHHLNDYAASTSSYIGLNPIFFAAR
jgi:hypothetical protein